MICFASLAGITSIKLINEANSFEERADNIDKLGYDVVFIVFYAYVVRKSPELFEFIDCLDDLIGKSWYHFYNHRCSLESFSTY